MYVLAFKNSTIGECCVKLRKRTFFGKVKDFEIALFDLKKRKLDNRIN